VRDGSAAVTGVRIGLSAEERGRARASRLGVRGKICAAGPAHRPAGPGFHKQCLCVTSQRAAEGRMKYPG
jgi:hypothetical protein